nr:522872p [Chlamydomonas reinhardtii]
MNPRGGHAGMQPWQAPLPAAPSQPQAGGFARFFQRQPTAAQAPQQMGMQPQPHNQQPAAGQSVRPIAAGQQHPGEAQAQAQNPPPPAPQYLADMLTPGNSAARPLTVSGASVPQPSRTRFAIFQRRNGPAPAPGPAPLPQQSPALAFPPPHGRPLTGPGPGPGWPTGTTASSGTRDTQAVQELVGGNWIFLIFVPYFVATALQDTHLRIGLIVATATSGVVLALGLLAFIMKLRKVFPHVLEVLMLIMYAVVLGVSYSSQAAEAEVRRTYNFIVHSALAGTCLVSMLVCYPLGRQHVAELVHSLYTAHADVHSVGLYTTAGLTTSFVSSCLLYLIPLCKGRDDEHWDVLNLIFRIIYPCVCTAVALLFARYLPDALLPNLAVVHGLNRRPPARLPAYLTNLLGLRPPAILDYTM